MTFCLQIFFERIKTFFYLLGGGLVFARNFLCILSDFSPKQIHVLLRRKRPLSSFFFFFKLFPHLNLKNYILLNYVKK